MKESFLFLADGFEEIEALATVDILRRAGISLRTVSITANPVVTGAHGVSVKADVIYDSTLFTDPAWLILPGGMPGAANLHDFSPLLGLLKRQFESKEGRIAAICAAPAVVLGSEGLLKGRKATCYPGFEGDLKGAEYVNEPVVVDDKFVLGNGPGNAFKFALAIVSETLGEEKASEVASGMLLYPANVQPENLFG